MQIYIEINIESVVDEDGLEIDNRDPFYEGCQEEIRQEIEDALLNLEVQADHPTGEHSYTLTLDCGTPWVEREPEPDAPEAVALREAKLAVADAVSESLSNLMVARAYLGSGTRLPEGDKAEILADVDAVLDAVFAWRAAGQAAIDSIRRTSPMSAR